MIRVRVAETPADFMMQTLSIMIGHYEGDRLVSVWVPGPHGGRWTNHEDGTVVVPDEAVLRLPADAARSIAVELDRHFGGTEDARALRRDYEAERARVDRLIGAFIAPPS